MGNPRTWLDACSEFGERSHVASEYVSLLHAFSHPYPRGGPPPPPERAWADSFEALERELLEPDDVGRVAQCLEGEVDRGQAEMFERRTRAVDRSLCAFADPTARVMRVGLRCRLRRILSAPSPRAVRVRALADFYYSYASRHHHDRIGTKGPSVLERCRALLWSDVAHGLERATLDGPTDNGPVHVNVLRMDPKLLTLRVVDCRPDVERGRAFTDTAANYGALAAVSGGFFLYSEADIQSPSSRYDPVGLLIDCGSVRSPPIFPRGAVAVDEHGSVYVGRIGMHKMTMTVAGHAFDVERIFNRADGDTGPDVDSLAIASGQVVAVGRRLPVPLNGFVTPIMSIAGLTAGMPVSFTSPVLQHGPKVASGIAGGPLLLERGRSVISLRDEDFWGTAPPITFSQDETGDRNLLPRLAAGIDRQGRLIFAAVDGRNLERALGMTLAGVAELMKGLGCTSATNLDGGSSKRMVVGGQTLDLPTTEIVAKSPQALAVRPVYTAVMLVPSGLGSR